MSDLLNAALSYAARGWPVFPVHHPDSKGNGLQCSCNNPGCQSPAKHPLTSHGVLDATTDAERIRAWWKEYPFANIGLAMGQESGVVAVDIDGEEAKDAFKAKFPDLDFDRIPRQRTGRPEGGWHLIFQSPGVPIKNGTGILPKTDFRGDHGYIIGAPSVHISGRPYVWQIPLNGNIPKLTPELYELIKNAGSNGQHKPVDMARVLDGLPHGERDVMLFKSACKLRRADIPQDTAEEIILKAARNCSPPFPEGLALEKVANAYSNYPAGGQEGPEAGKKITSDLRERPSEVTFLKEMNLGELQEKAKTAGVDPITYLPVLGQARLIVKGWSCLLASYPKTGKTELLIRVISEWQQERVLFFTEEPESVWHVRLSRLPAASLQHVTLCVALGAKPTDILNRIIKGTESVVVLDTVRNLLSLRDETDNSEVARALIPYIAACRIAGKTFIPLHHDRKGGGEHGEGISGGHAFLGVVDIALEIKRDGQEDSPRRIIRGWGRVIEIQKIMYELREDGRMVALGSPALVAIREVKERVLAKLEPEEKLQAEWLKTKQVQEKLDDPKPSEDQVLKALESLGQDGEVERDPPLSEGKKRGKRYKWRWVEKKTSDEPPPRSEVNFSPGKEADTGPHKANGEDQCQTFDL